MQPLEIRTRRYGDGETVFERGNPAPCMYMVLRGKVRVHKDVRGTDVQLDTLGRGELVGDVAFLTSRLHSATARALGETELWMITSDDLQQVARDPLAHKLFTTLATRLRTMDDLYAELRIADERRRRCLSAISRRNECA